MKRAQAEYVRLHELKEWPAYFRDLLSCRKKFEVRKHDRDFRVGDALLLREWDPAKESYTGRQVVRVVDYVSRLDAVGCPGFVGLGLSGKGEATP